MYRFQNTTRNLAAVAALLLIIAAPAISFAQAAPPGHAVKVMSQNLYLGTDLAPIINAGTEAELLAAVASRFEQVQRTNFPARAELIADKIAREQPDLVGLSECVIWYTGPVDPHNPATTVRYDYLEILMAALAARNQPYRVVAVANGYDVEAPGLFSFGPMDVRLADREVIIARTDRKMTFRNAVGVNFENFLTLSVLGQPQYLRRGYASADVTFRGKEFRFISTHLEGFHPYFNVAQGQEILSGPANTAMDVIYVGDLNSPATGIGPFQAYPQARAAGFVDAWSSLYPNDLGYTFGHNDEVNDPPAFTERIDYILYRGAKLVPVGASLFGLDPTVVTPGGRYPSDHAGVIATIVVR